MTIVRFLRARLDDDERIAQAAMPGPWSWRTDQGAFGGEPDPPEAPRWGHCGPDLIAANGEDVITSIGHDADNVIVLRADAEHIAHHDPARVLAEVAAKRQQIDMTFRYEATIDGEWGCCHTAEEIASGRCSATPVDEIVMLRLLALPHVEHPDYREEWKP